MRPGGDRAAQAAGQASAGDSQAANKAAQKGVTGGSFVCGDVEIIRVPELTTALPRALVFPETPERLWEKHRDWLVPEFWRPEPDEIVIRTQSWVLRNAGRTILIDTGVGNHRPRPGMPIFDQLDTGYLANLAQAGVRPEEVDLVVCTHVHGDHIGWNATYHDGVWVPTFPRAQYLISRPDFDYWDPQRSPRGSMEPWMRNAYLESITPVHQAGLTMLWEQPHFDIDASLRLSLAPGHTPGSAVLWLRSGTDRAVFVGDLFHSPLQMVHPDQGPCFDERPDQARRTRTGLLEAAVEQNALIIPAHFPGAGAVEVFRRGDGFHVRAWRGAG